jgi:acyl dehydratase
LISDNGPWFEDLSPGMVVEGAPAVTLTSGHAALHQAIVGDRLRLALDADLSRSVLAGEAPLAHPALVWDVAIGQSTIVTQRVIANLFYRGFVFHRAPLIGDTLATTTEVVALRQNATREGRRPSGLAVLRVETHDLAGRAVLGFWRCAMLPLRDAGVQTGRADDLASIPERLDEVSLGRALTGWRLDAFRVAVPGPHFDSVQAGSRWEIESGDVVSSAPELARLTLNVASAHLDPPDPEGERLVYGGHTIGIALAQATRVLPNLLTVVAWHSCDHVAPVRDGDRLRSTLELERTEPLPQGGGLLHLRSRVWTAGDRRDVLDWRFVAAMA